MLNSEFKITVDKVGIWIAKAEIWNSEPEFGQSKKSLNQDSKKNEVFLSKQICDKRLSV